MNESLYIKYLAHMLDESMLDKTNESVEGMQALKAKRELQKIIQEDPVSDPPTWKELHEFKKARLMPTPENLPDGIKEQVQIKDEVLVKEYSNGLDKWGETWYFSYKPQKEHYGMRFMFIPKDADFYTIYSTTSAGPGDRKFTEECMRRDIHASDEILNLVVKALAGYVVAQNSISHILSIIGGHGYDSVEGKVEQARKREQEWKKNTLSAIELDKKFGKIHIPESTHEEKEFIAKCTEMNGGKDLYEAFVPDENTDIEGERVDVDDWDHYTINYQDTISEEDFYQQLLDNVDADFEPGSEVDASEIYDYVVKVCETIANDAFENYQPSDEQLTYKAHRHYGGYYPQGW